MKYLILIICGFNLLISNDHIWQNKLLFCLKGTVEPLIIERNENSFITNIEPLNTILKSINAYSLELWLPGATDDDYDGDIYLNRIYQLKFESRSIESIQNTINQLDSCTYYYNPKYEDLCYDCCKKQWNEDCINFHQFIHSMGAGDNSINIHKPIYKSSMQYWKLYEKQLKPLIEVLNI